jgi:hypothetical protein
MGRTDEERDWAERVVRFTQDSYVDIAVNDPVLGSALLQAAEDEIARAVKAWRVVRPPGAVSIDVAPDTIRIHHGDAWLAGRWDGTAERAEAYVRDSIWRFADQWPKQAT